MRDYFTGKRIPPSKHVIRLQQRTRCIICARAFNPYYDMRYYFYAHPDNTVAVEPGQCTGCGYHFRQSH